MQLVPQSWGSPLREFNQCHSPADGRFCQTVGGGATFTDRQVPDGEGGGRVFTMRDRSGADIGRMHYRVERGWGGGGGTAQMEYLGLNKEHRGHGYGERLYRTFASHARQRLGVSYVMGEVTSGAVLRLGIRVFGKPESITDDVNKYSLRKAMKQLEPLSPENAEGVIDTGNYLTVRWKLRRDLYSKLQRVREFNQCHSPADGKFCSTPGASSAGKPTFRAMSGFDGFPASFEMSLADGTVVGKMQYDIHSDWMGGKGAVEMHYLGIDKAHRGKGYGEQLYRAFASHARSLGVTHVVGDVTSAGVLRLGVKVFGRPERLSDAISNVSVPEAMKRLSARSPENAEGIIDTGNYLTVRWKLKRSYGSEQRAQRRGAVLDWNRYGLREARGFREFNLCHSPQDGKFCSRGGLLRREIARARKMGIDVSLDAGAGSMATGYYAASQDIDTGDPTSPRVVLGTNSALWSAEDGWPAGARKRSLLSVTRHELGHHTFGDAKGVNAIAGQTFGNQYTDEFGAWRHAIRDAPNHRLHWPTVKRSLTNYLLDDPLLWGRIKLKLRKAKIDPNDLRLAELHYNRILDSHVNLLKRYGRRLRTRKAARGVR